MSQLRECPFCKDIPQPPTAYTIDDCWGVRAKIFCCVEMEGYAERNKNAPDRHIEVERAYQEAIDKVTKQWNTRHPQRDVQGLVDALKMIAGKIPCPDNLMGNVDIAVLALKSYQEGRG